MRRRYRRMWSENTTCVPSIPHGDFQSAQVPAHVLSKRPFCQQNRFDCQNRESGPPQKMSRCRSGACGILIKTLARTGQPGLELA